MEQDKSLSVGSQWYVLRDLRRANAKVSAYDRLLEAGYDVFTPLRWVIAHKGGISTRRRIPVIPDLLFIRTTRAEFDPELSHMPSLQYRYVRGSQSTPMVVRNADMATFIHAVRVSDDIQYYRPDEISPSMCGRRICIVGGPLDGYEGNLLKVRGTRVKRLLVSLPGLITVAVEVSPDFIRLL